MQSKLKRVYIGWELEMIFYKLLMWGLTSNIIQFQKTSKVEKVWVTDNEQPLYPNILHLIRWNFERNNNVCHEQLKPSIHSVYSKT